MSSPFAGTTQLVRLILRRDRAVLPSWFVGLGGTIAASAISVPTIYDTPVKVAGYAAAIGASPVSHLMSGRQAGIDTLDGIVANEISQVAQLGVCLMVMFLVVRHTRAEEESGRAELVRSTVVGRHAATLAGLAYGVLAALLIGALTTVTMLAVDLDVTGSVAYGTGLALLGTCYAAISLVAAQIATSARGALGLTVAVIAVGYLLRGVGAMQDTALVWASPFGWAQEMNAFGQERWWPAVLLVLVTAGLLVAAGRLTVRRDFGAGVLPSRPGRPRASALLGTPWGLTVRLQRGLVAGWTVGLTALGLLYGAVMPTVPDLVSSNPDIAEIIGAAPGAEDALIDAFLQYVLLFMAVVSCGFVVTSVLRFRGEEETGRAELLLATALRRPVWMAVTVAVAVLGVLLLTVTMGLGLAVGYAIVSGEWSDVLERVLAQLSYLPATLVVGGLAVTLVGLRPRRAGLAWAAVAFVAVQVLLGETLRLPEWVDAISPYWHLAKVPVESFDPVPAVIELALAAALVAVGVWGHRRRDIAT